jgi:hypothetical protein
MEKIRIKFSIVNKLFDFFSLTEINKYSIIRWIGVHWLGHDFLIDIFLMKCVIYW